MNFTFNFFFQFTKWSPLLLSLSCAHAVRVNVEKKCRFIFYWSLLLKCRRVQRLYRYECVCLCAHNCASRQCTVCSQCKQQGVLAETEAEEAHKIDFMSLPTFPFRYILYMHTYMYICTETAQRQSHIRRNSATSVSPFTPPPPFLLCLCRLR